MPAPALRAPRVVPAVAPPGVPRREAAPGVVPAADDPLPPRPAPPFELARAAPGDFAGDPCAGCPPAPGLSPATAPFELAEPVVPPACETEPRPCAAPPSLAPDEADVDLVSIFVPAGPTVCETGWIAPALLLFWMPPPYGLWPDAAPPARVDPDATCASGGVCTGVSR
jgi:hypothetical protein